MRFNFNISKISFETKLIDGAREDEGDDDDDDDDCRPAGEDVDQARDGYRTLGGVVRTSR